MTGRGSAMHVARNRRAHVAKSGERRVYESVLVRRTYRQDGKVRHETLANLSALPAEALLTDPEGRPAAVRVLGGSTADPSAFTAIVKVVREKFGLEKMVMVGDRGMITSARITALNQPEDDGTAPSGYGWITALHAPAVGKLACLALDAVHPAWRRGLDPYGSRIAAMSTPVSLPLMPSTSAIRRNGVLPW